MTIDDTPKGKIYSFLVEKHGGGDKPAEYMVREITTSEATRSSTMTISKPKEDGPFFKLNEAQFEEMKKGGNTLVKSLVNTADKIDCIEPASFPDVEPFPLSEVWKKRYEERDDKNKHKVAAIPSEVKQEALAAIVNDNSFVSAHQSGPNIKSIPTTVQSV